MSLVPITWHICTIVFKILHCEAYLVERLPVSRRRFNLNNATAWLLHGLTGSAGHVIVFLFYEGFAAAGLPQNFSDITELKPPDVCQILEEIKINRDLVSLGDVLLEGNRTNLLYYHIGRFIALEYS